MSIRVGNTSALKYSLCAIKTLSCIHSLRCPIGQPDFQYFTGIRTKRAPHRTSWVLGELEHRIIAIIYGIIRTDECTIERDAKKEKEKFRHVEIKGVGRAVLPCLANTALVISQKGAEGTRR